MVWRAKHPSTAKAWEYQVGERPNTLTAYERQDRKGTIELRWWVSDLRRYARKGLGIRIRDDSGAIVHDLERRAMILTQEWHERLTAKGKPKRKEPHTHERDPTPMPKPRRSLLTLVQGFDLATSAERGLYVGGTKQFNDACRAVRDLTWAIGTDEWGVPRTWAESNYSTVREIWIRLAQRYAERGMGSPSWTERCVRIFLQVNLWLQLEDLIDRGITVKKTWREQMQRDWEQVTSFRTDCNARRHSVKETAKIFAALSDDRVDPRIALAVELAVEALPHQVRRLMRADVDLGSVGTFSLGRMVVHNSRNKRRVLYDLTPSQRAAVDRALNGYLRDLEWQYQAGLRSNYPMFPAARLSLVSRSTRLRRPSAAPGEKQARLVRPDFGDKVIGKRSMTYMFHKLELIAGVKPVPGRGWCGISRGTVRASRTDPRSHQG
jgi:hypothetical protein